MHGGRKEAPIRTDAGQGIHRSATHLRWVHTAGAQPAKFRLTEPAAMSGPALRAICPTRRIPVTLTHSATYDLSPCHAGPYGDHQADRGDHVAHETSLSCRCFYWQENISGGPHGLLEAPSSLRPIRCALRCLSEFPSGGCLSHAGPMTVRRGQCCFQ
jgi:hypothetical protein